ncbi:hypothetical protein ASPACDRAFT_1860847 [Aspergillus aculeatus ATCC 16872]|uniref:CCHC-type domain-containing protein n=1 Tax=Aspergillus aculeatus (strain ATCC 16872 / CBS 172.66 / WB 5094) TaxID=690307 RepID=A0A1L9WEF3_ASPA1|nr:uncharacterized protein ASPACDRAFT_1860847 [Aspergillus aculeatus ATCC 16872]OJJ94559.1 hypothetical protein ASPACDRAFT_1860847 [Aspergillus aculeatus ATCC 16872]
MKAALSYIVKGCEIAINRAALLEQEVDELRTGLERQNAKNKRSHRQMAGLNGLTVDEAKNAFKRVCEADQVGGSQFEESAAGEEQPRRRAPPRCSDCNTIGHIRTRCPTRQNTN